MPITASIDSASASSRLKLFAYRNAADCVAVTDGGDGTRQDKQNHGTHRRAVAVAATVVYVNENLDSANSDDSADDVTVVVVVVVVLAHCCFASAFLDFEARGPTASDPRSRGRPSEKWSF
ncbi:hypothetical protein GCK72_011372 [Caenorhabditis remanei]|uniref:Uncharacterized protein n=1 Tax=Caenorhabditis remanei TaxID=31234 RepID=A0A6A5H7E1_CAERE|nr:hypothetical protein GCK72_011372 [Caenorhabditis remanei]KAF1763107.1 hypothetical protein GCK72_011372 [Caenorhabditis remanei]